jgi:hypothetical protein
MITNDTSTEEVSLETIAKFQLIQAEKLLTRISTFLETPKGQNISGLAKLQKRVQSEKEFVEELLSGQIKLQQSHVECSNLGYLAAVFDIAEVEIDVIAIQKVYHNLTEKKKERYEVDIVCRNGGMWIKVKAMKPETIQALFFGNGSYGTKGLDAVAEQMVHCAQQHPYNFKAPVCIFWFVNGVTSDVVEELEAIGIISHGTVIDESLFAANNKIKGKKKELKQLVEEKEKFFASIPDDNNFNFASDCDIANLDITTLICYVSHIANELDINGNSTTEYSDPLLQQQAFEERKCPVLPIINKMMEGKKLVCTNIAWEKFWGILETIGGEQERQRAKDLLERIEIIDINPSSRALSLSKGTKIKQQHIDIFGTGDSIKAVTLTANAAFLRVASDQGVDFNVFLHPARALTEQKIKQI